MTSHQTADDADNAQLALDVCSAIEQGDDARLAALLNIYAEGTAISNERCGEEKDRSSSSANAVALLHNFYHLVGYAADNSFQSDREDRRYNDVKTHLVLKALLRVSTLDPSLCLISWQAVTAFVKALQFSSNNSTARMTGHSEERKMIADIRTFLSTSLLSIMSSLHGAKRKLEYINQSSEQLLLLGHTIIASLLRKLGLTDETTAAITRRHHSYYLLPLELIPAILSVADAMDDSRADISEVLAREEFSFRLKVQRGEDSRDDQSMEVEHNEANTICSDLKTNNNESLECVQVKSEEEAIEVRVSDTLLNALFNSQVQRNNGTVMRADAVLPLLALSIDDIRSSHMSASCPDLKHGTTYWDCLRWTLDHVFASIISRCTSDEEPKTEVPDKMNLNEDIHIIPHADYPALLRCIFRMITATSSASYTGQPLSPSWESLLLHSYHAAIVTALSPRIMLSHQRQTVDRLSILNTIESHVLLPTITAASVSIIRSVLSACTVGCCSSCKRASYSFTHENMVPPFAVARMTLLIMRARTSIVSDSSSKDLVGFGPRSIFRMTTAVLQRDGDIAGDQNGVDSGLVDEFEMALSVLLNLSKIDSGSCPTCSDVYANSRGDLAAFAVLKGSYYGGNGDFLPRYANPSAKKATYRHELGLGTLISYVNLIRASLTHGKIHPLNKPHLLESFVADAAQVWLNAASMLLDDRSKSATTESKDGLTTAAFAAVILIVVFFQVPSSQRDIIQNLYDRLASSLTNDSCCDATLSILSTLVWSMASKAGRSSSTIFSRTGDSLRFDMSVFEPMCSILSRPIASDENHAVKFFTGNETQRLPHAAALKMARSLLPNPSAREGILSIAKKHMRVFVRPSTSPFFGSVLCAQSANRDSVYLASACLCMLIETHNSKKAVLDDCGCEALTMLTDIIVLHRPSATTPAAEWPSEVLSWIIAEINSSVSLERVSTWTCQRLLRACFYAMLNCSTLEKKESDNQMISVTFCFANSSLAIPDLAGLLRLSTSLCDRLNGSSGCQARASLNAYILRTLLQRKQEMDSVEEFFGIIENGSTSSDERSSTVVDWTLLALLLGGAAKTFHDDYSYEMSHSSHTQKIARYLQHSERMRYSEREGSKHESHPLIPNWLEGKQVEPNASAMLSLCPKKSAMEISPLCDLFVELFARRCASINTDDTIPESDLISGLNILCDRGQPPVNSVVPISRSSTYNLIYMYSRYLQDLLKSNNQQKHILAQLEKAIKYAFNFGRLAISSMANEKSYVVQQFDSLWSLYCSIADEHSSRMLVSFTLGVYKEIGWSPSLDDVNNVTASGVNESTFSLTAISSDEVFDEQVLYIRGSALSFLSHLTSLTPDFMLDHDEKTILLSSLLRSLLKLCSDLCDGFQGYSGGMRKSLFIQYARAIDGCVNSIASITDTLSANQLHERLSSFAALNEAIVIVWESFCDNSFKDAFLVKAVLKLCVDKLPGLVRKIEMNAGRRIDPHTQLMPCVSLLEYSTCLLKATTGTDAEVNYGGAKMEHSTIRELQKPNFASSNVIVWAYCIAFASMSTIWHESNKVIMATNTRGLPSKAAATSHTASTKLRIHDFFCLCSSVNKMFDRTDQTSRNNADVNSTPSQERIAAKELSHRGKSYLCSCLDKMSITLLFSIKTVTGYLSQAHPVDPKTIESSACVIGCALSIISQSSIAYDAITGPIKWFAEESNGENPSVNYSVLHRLPKIIHRSEIIHMELQKLHMIVRGSKGMDEGWMDRLQMLNEMTLAYVPNATASLAFKELLDNATQAVNSQMALLRDVASEAGLFSDGEDGSVDEDGFAGSRKRRRNFALLRSRRISLRSRNETIDDWLTLDNEDLATGERFNRDDAFVDLEDFLVEG